MSWGSRRPTVPGEFSDQIVGPLSVDLVGHVAYVSGLALDLTAREFDLLCHLARHPGWVYSRQELLEQVWGYEFGDPRVVTVHMANLRKKLERCRAWLRAHRDRAERGLQVGGAGGFNGRGRGSPYPPSPRQHRQSRR